jgi:hypothetical protein
MREAMAAKAKKAKKKVAKRSDTGWGGPRMHYKSTRKKAAKKR